jgi:hypothetical protein
LQYFPGFSVQAWRWTLDQVLILNDGQARYLPDWIQKREKNALRKIRAKISSKLLNFSGFPVGHEQIRDFCGTLNDSPSWIVGTKRISFFVSSGRSKNTFLEFWNVAISSKIILQTRNFFLYLHKNNYRTYIGTITIMNFLEFAVLERWVIATISVKVSEANSCFYEPDENIKVTFFLSERKFNCWNLE